MSKATRAELIEALIAANRRYQQATDMLDQATADMLGVNRTDARCIDVLHQRGPLSAGELADASGLSPGAVTTVIDRLERAGYARRLRDEHDRRRVLVEVTELTNERAAAIYGPLVERSGPLFSDLSDQHLRVIRRFLEHAGELQRTRAEELSRPMHEGVPVPR
ncbi:MAG TPA: MarR family transcriptional regulator [Thermoleophilaceae bacterium]|nr:MarR family transcriptional regulator [Thermoleophilaceae bacterium]